MNYSELKRLAEAAIEHGKSVGEEDWYCLEFLGSIYKWASIEDPGFIASANPAVVLALIAENERYRQNGCDTCDGSGHLSRADGEYFGACTSCGAYELEQAKRERDQLKAENERLRLALKSAEDAMWKAESNMDNEAADIRDLLAAMDQGEQSGG